MGDTMSETTAVGATNLVSGYTSQLLVQVAGREFQKELWHWLACLYEQVFQIQKSRLVYTFIDKGCRQAFLFPTTRAAYSMHWKKMREKLDKSDLNH